MRMLARNVSVVALAATLAACGLLGGGKAPPYLYTLTPQAAGGERGGQSNDRDVPGKHSH